MPSRIVLKISGEVVGSDRTDETINLDVVAGIAKEVAVARDLADVQLAIVVGGGNIWRGARGSGRQIDRPTSDNMGMLGTVLNALAFQAALEACGQVTRVQSAIAMADVCEPFIRRRAIRHLEKGRVVVFAAGIGRPFFTTDTTAALRAAEIGAHKVVKGTSVNGIYTADPRTDASAKHLPTVTFDCVLEQRLEVMDLTAFTLCRENGIPIEVFDVTQEGNLRKILCGEEVTHTLVHP